MWFWETSQVTQVVRAYVVLLLVMYPTKRLFSVREQTISSPRSIADLVSNRLSTGSIYHLSSGQEYPILVV
jgi:hypothetical protein